MTMTLKEWQTKIESWAKEKGWWEDLDLLPDQGSQTFVRFIPDRRVDAPITVDEFLRMRREYVVKAIATKLALIHSEASEALEEARRGRFTVWTDSSIERVNETGIPKPEGLPIEIADIVIRCMELASNMGFDLEEMIETKMAYNRGRAYRHGGRLV